MSLEPSTRVARVLWQAQPLERHRFSTEEMRHMSTSFNRQIQWRNGREYAAAAAVVAFSAWRAYGTDDGVVRVAHLLLVAGALYVGVQLRRRGRAREMPGAVAAQTCRAYLRGDLSRQRQLLLGVWRWYLGPLLPGVVVLLSNQLWHAAARGAAAALGVLASAALTGLVFALVARLNRRAAATLADRIAALDADAGVEDGASASA